MAGRLIEVIVRVDDRQYKTAMRSMGRQAEATATTTERAGRRTAAALRSTGAAAQSTGRFLTGVGLGLGALGYVGVKSAISFQTAMTRIQTQAGATKSQTDALTKSVLNLGQSGKVQYGPTDLANALYHIESVAAGTFPQLRNTSNAMAALKIAAEGAAVGGSDLEETTSALMGALFATRAPLSQLPRMMGLINATVGAGNMRMSDLVQALGRGVIPAFKQVGLTATDAFAALALFADSGVKASSSAAQVSTALHFLVQPSAKADKFLAAIGMTQYQMAADLRSPHGMIAALSDLREHLNKYAGGANSLAAGQVLASIFPGGRGRILLTAIQNLDRYGNKINAIYDQQGKFQQSVDAQGNTLSGKLHKAWAVIQTDLTKFGITLMPIISKYLPTFTKDVTDIFKWLANLPPGFLQFLTKMAALLVVGGPIIWGLGKFISMLGTLKTAWMAIKTAAMAAFGAEKLATFAGGGGGAGGAAAAAAGGVGYRSLIKSEEEKAAEKGASRFSKFRGFAKDAGGLIPGVALAAGVIAAIPVRQDPLRSRKTGAPLPVRYSTGIAAKYDPTAGGHYGGLVTGRGIRRYQTGGLVGFPGGPMGSDNVPAWLEAGEGVLNRTAMAGLGVSGLGMLNSGLGFPPHVVIEPAPVNVYLDGRLVARSVLQQTLRKAARGPSGLVGGQITTGARTVG